MPELRMKITTRMFNDIYLPQLDNYSTRWNFYYGSAGSGKSVFVVQKLIIKAMKSPRRVLVVRKYGTTIRQSVYQLFKDILRDFKIIDHCKVTESMLNIKLPNGSEIIFLGLDDEQKLLSIQDISDVFVEEATETSRDILEQLNLRMRGSAPYHQIHLCFNPVSTLNFMYEFMEVNPPKDSYKLKTTFRDNKFLPQSYIDSLMDLYRTNPRKAKVYCDGEWGVMGLLVFEDNWDIKDFDFKQLVKNTKYSKTPLEARFGGDFGFTLDPTTLIATLYNKDKEEIYIFDELYERGLTNPELAHKIKNMQYHKQRIFFDCADPKSITELNRLGIFAKPAKKGKDSIKFGLAFLNRHKIYVHPKCRNTINEFKDYQYKKDKQTGEYIMDKFEGADHAIDALRYAYAEIYTQARFKSISKEYFGL
jgi:phage terminase large subunit